MLAAAPLAPTPPTTAVATVPWRRNELGATAGLKTTSYAENVIALAAAHQIGASEALLANVAGNLCEGTGSNVFVGVDGQLVTPPLSSGCLAGVTRALLLETGVAVEGDLPFSVLDDATEAVLTSTTREVQAVHRIDDRDLPGAPGPLAQVAMAAFAEVARTDDP
jgi:branched-chain amino acid aminotransferase